MTTSARLLGCLLPAACCLLLAAAPARADDALRKELAVVARGIAEAVKGLGHQAIAVGEFTGPAQLAASGGAAVGQTPAAGPAKKKGTGKPHPPLRGQGGVGGGKGKPARPPAPRAKGGGARP